MLFHWFKSNCAKTRSSHRKCSIKKVFLKISQNSQKKTYARVSSLIKLQAWGLQLYQKGGSGTGAFLRISRNSQEYLFYRIPPEDCFWKGLGGMVICFCDVKRANSSTSNKKHLLLYVLLHIEQRKTSIFLIFNSIQKSIHQPQYSL